MNVADQLVSRLAEWGIECIFGFSGDGIDPILGALARNPAAPRLVTARHEETAAFMAVGYAKWTGTVGCCLATQGPGAVHLLNGLYDARLDRQPVLAIVGQQHRSVLGSGYQQEIDLGTLFKDVCASFVNIIASAEQMPLVLDKALKAAIASRSPTCIIIPHDVQQLDVVAEPDHRHGIVVTSAGVAEGTLVPRQEDVEAAASLLNEGERVAILVGQGAFRASAEVVEAADVLGAGIAKALLGKAVVGDDLPHVTGAIGHLGTVASELMMRDCDTLLMIGTNEPYTEFLPKPGQARAVQIDIDPRNLGTRYPTEVNLAGDAAETLRRLIPKLTPKTDRPWRAQIEAAVNGWHRIAARRAARAESPVNAQHVVRALSDRLPDDALIALDVGSVTYWYARHICLRGTMRAHLSSTLASMGSALPYAIAAKAAMSDRLVVALAGDGAMQMVGLAELVTVAKMWPEWSDPRLPILVLDNGDLGEVTWEQRELEGDRRFPDSQRVTSIPYADYAALLGLDGCRVDQPHHVDAAWDAALAADRPYLIHAMVDPAAPLLPPRVEPAAKEKMLKALDAEGTATAKRARQFLLDEIDEQERLLASFTGTNA